MRRVIHPSLKIAYKFWLLSTVCGVVLTASAFAQQSRYVVIDQDAMGPAGTDMNSILVFLQARNVNVLGITVVTGDGWRDEEVAHTLRLLGADGAHGYSGRGRIGISPGAYTAMDARLGADLRQGSVPGGLEQLPSTPRRVGSSSFG